MADVARIAETSVMSVSYSYSRSYRVSESLRRRISEAAQLLGYEGPHSGAQMLRNSSACVITAVTEVGEHGMFSDYQSAQVLAGVAETIMTRSGSVVCAPVNSRRSLSAERTLFWPDSVGCELLPNDASGVGARVTLWPSGFAVSGIPNVWFDDYLTASELLKAVPGGVKRPLLIGARDRQREHETWPRTAQRLSGLYGGRLKALRAALEAIRGLAGQHVPVLWAPVAPADTDDEPEFAAMLTKYRPDLVMAVSDELALAVSSLVGQRRRSALSITGWGGSEAATRVGIVTFKPDWARLGSLGTEILLEGSVSGAPTGYVLSRVEDGMRGY